MANSILADCLTAIDNQTRNTNQITRTILIKKWLMDFAKQKHPLRYSDHLAFSVPANAQGGC